MKDLRTTGLYKSCGSFPSGLAFYFPVYSIACTNHFVRNHEGSSDAASSANILLLGTLAAVPALLPMNPMDLVKTRLQVASLLDEELYRLHQEDPR